MGKRKRELMRELRGRVAEFGELKESKKEEFRQNVSAQVRARYLPRWMAYSEELTGRPCTSMEDIVWDDPQIHLESLLCDPVYCLSLRREDVRREFLGQLSEEEVELFFHRDENGDSYSDLVHPNIVRALKDMLASQGETSSDTV